MDILPQLPIEIVDRILLHCDKETAETALIAACKQKGDLTQSHYLRTLQNLFERLVGWFSYFLFLSLHLSHFLLSESKLNLIF